eukprot:3840376-Pyramimonas_sp.AAC.1
MISTLSRTQDPADSGCSSAKSRPRDSWYRAISQRSRMKATPLRSTSPRSLAHMRPQLLANATRKPCRPGTWRHTGAGPAQ